MESLAPCLGRFARKPMFAKMFLGDSDTAFDLTSLGELNAGKVNFAINSRSPREEKLTVSLATTDKRFPFQWSQQFNAGKNAATGEQQISENATLDVEITSALDGTLYKNSIKAERPDPMVFSYIYTDIDNQILNFVCRRGDSSPASMKITLFKEGTQEEVWSSTADAPQRAGIVNVTFPIADMPAGRYDMTVVAFNHNNALIFKRFEHYFKPDGTPVWMQTKARVSVTPC
jgi:hypothetical protein